jgi:hypothetical protein
MIDPEDWESIPQKAAEMEEAVEEAGEVVDD